MLLVLLFLPGTWIWYGLCRYLLSYLDIPVGDQMALAFLAGLVYLATAVLRTWELWQRTFNAPQATAPQPQNPPQS